MKFQSSREPAERRARLLTVIRSLHVGRARDGMRKAAPRPLWLLVALFGVILTAVPLIALDATYTVQANDTAYSIARKYGVPVDLLLKTNHISDPRMLRIGTVLSIPGAELTGTYEVKRGDTLYGISRRFQVTVDDLRRANGIAATGILRAGDKLIIPGQTAGATPDVQVAAGSGNTVVLPGLAPGGSGREERSEGDERRESGSAAGTTAPTGGASIGANRDATRTTSSGGEGDATTASTAGSDATSGSAAHSTAQAVTVSAPVTGPVSGGDGPWPHAGTRYALTGKFPGLLIKGKPGDPVVAVADGRVIYTGPYSTFGNVVLVQSSNGYVYVYGGNDKVNVSPGEQIHSGTVLGRLAKSFFQDGAEVYFSVWKDNQFINPVDAPRG